MTELMKNPVGLIGIAAIVAAGVWAGILLWRKKKQQAAKSPAPAESSSAPVAANSAGSRPDGNQIPAIFRDAESRLKLSPAMKGASLSRLPVFLVAGPSGAGKTSAVEHSGLNPELLAGQVYQGSAVLPTRDLNIWLAGGAIFIEIAQSIAGDEGALKAVFKHLTPSGITAAFNRAQPPRGIVLCVDQAAIATAATPDEVVALARPWNRFVSLAASSLGVQLPAYVLLTKTDGFGTFPDFVANLRGNDLGQTIGATIRPFAPGSAGVYAQDTSLLLTQQFAGIAHSLSDARLPLLNREHDRARVAQAYQFPRDFSKLQKNVVQFLVEVARPSQLQVSPFLRGFYFSGTRTVVVEGSESAVSPIAAAPTDVDVSATRVMRRDEVTLLASGPAQPPAGQRHITEWLFLPALFDRVILHDRAAHGVTATNSRTDKVRAGVLAFTGILGIALLAALTVSYIRNRALERDLIIAGKAVSDTGSAVSIYARLDRMRRPLERLIAYRSKPPLSMRWGLDHGEDLLSSAQAGYCTAIKSQVLPPAMQTIRARLEAIQTGKGDHSAEFGNLKAYMMMTTHPQKAEETFLSQELMNVWAEAPAHAAAPEENRFLPAEFRLYGALLSVPEAQSYCVNRPATGLVSASQGYLRALNASDRYRSLLQLAGKGIDPVNYNMLFPNDAVADAKIVPGWFTRPAWMKMQQLLEHPEDSLKADAWVLGESKDLTPQELASLAAEFKARYTSEYVQTWKEYLSSGRVAAYANLNDAVAKLEKIAGQHSVLLNLVGLAADHTSINNLNSVFQPVKAVVPATGDFQSAAGSYLEDLNSLKNRLSKASQSSGPAHDQDVAEVRSAATTARDAVDRMAVKTFKGDTDQMVKELLLRPIAQIDPLLDDFNAGGKDLCSSYDRISRLMPFSTRAQQSASLEDVQRIFQPETGQMWRYYDKSLRDSLDCFDNTCTLKASPKLRLSSGFLDFFRELNRWSRLIYAGNPDPVIRLQARAASLNHVRQIELVLGDSRVTLPAGAGEFQNLSWDLRRTQKLQVTGVFEDEPQTQDLFRTEGPWALFEWFYNAEPGSGGSDGFVWLPRSGTIKASLLKNGNTERYKLDIRADDGTGRFFDLRALTVAPCSLPAK
jgi:type VI secretion system protein ImpL